MNVSNELKILMIYYIWQAPSRNLKKTTKLNIKNIVYGTTQYLLYTNISKNILNVNDILLVVIKVMIMIQFNKGKELVKMNCKE